VEHVTENLNLRIAVVMSSAAGTFFEEETYASCDNKEGAER
jgi:hypothetical protein